MIEKNSIQHPSCRKNSTIKSGNGKDDPEYTPWVIVSPVKNNNTLY